MSEKEEYRGNDPRYPSQQQDRFIVRLPEGMRDQIKADAEKNSRSMNAEIVSRLTEFESRGHVIKRLQAEMALLHREREMMAIDLQKRRIEAEEARRDFESRIPRDQTLYIALDAEGKPLSWSEVMTHLGEIGRAADFNIDSISARVFDAATASNSSRENQWWDLIQHYRSLRKKRSKAKD